MTNKQKLNLLKESFVNEIRKEYTFLTDNVPCEFKQPFMIWLTEGYDTDVTKGSYVVYGMEEKNTLLAKSETNEIELQLDEIEDLVELAHILDELQNNNIKITQYE